MKLKYSILFLVVSCSLVGTALADETTPPQVDGTLTISGEVVTQTCKVDGNSNILVPLPTVSTNTLNATGKTAGMTPFPIKLTGCTAATFNSEQEDLESIGIYFSSFNVGENGTLENIASSDKNEDGTKVNAATNVNIQLLDKNQKIIKLSDNSENQVNYTQKLSEITNKGEITFDYYARYYATGISTAGKVKATVPFVIVYK